MKFFSKLFNGNSIVCPRCLGKGNVDMDDIIRLKKELHWLPGKCAYCNGLGKVPQSRSSKVAVDTAYLTIDLSRDERKRLLEGDSAALERAIEAEAATKSNIATIERLYFVEKQAINQICDYIFSTHGEREFSEYDRDVTLDYIKRVIEKKNSGR